jgi:hypothetical protein
MNGGNHMLIRYPKHQIEVSTHVKGKLKELRLPIPPLWLFMEGVAFRLTT